MIFWPFFPEANSEIDVCFLGGVCNEGRLLRMSAANFKIQVCSLSKGLFPEDEEEGLPERDNWKGIILRRHLTHTRPSQERKVKY